MKNNTENYEYIDNLRAVACVGIVMMHIRANSNYDITGFMYDKVIPSFTNFVFLFMTISAFGMCCGYYEKIISNTQDMEKFYKKRFVKIVPFFSVLVLFDVILSPSLSTINEAFADLTLMFGFLPNAGNINVVGVGWFLGVVFVFYLCFPFFCFLLQNKKRAWFAFGISLIYTFVSSKYFGIGRNNILYSFSFFMIGGLIFLYKDKIEKIKSYVICILLISTIVLYYIFGGSVVFCLLLSLLFMSLAVVYSQGGHSQSKYIKIISDLSMEIYLSHMMIFRIIQKIGLTTVVGNTWIQYLFTVLIVLLSTVVFSYVLKKILDWIM